MAFLVQIRLNEISVPGNITANNSLIPSQLLNEKCNSITFNVHKISALRVDKTSDFDFHVNIFNINIHKISVVGVDSPNNHMF